MASNIVTMVKNGQEVKVVDTAFEKVWKDKGWRLKGEKADAPKPAPKLEAVKKTTESATD